MEDTGVPEKTSNLLEVTDKPRLSKFIPIEYSDTEKLYLCFDLTEWYFQYQRTEGDIENNRSLWHLERALWRHPETVYLLEWSYKLVYDIPIQWFILFFLEIFWFLAFKTDTIILFFFNWIPRLIQFKSVWVQLNRISVYTFKFLLFSPMKCKEATIC